MTDERGLGRLAMFGLLEYCFQTSYRTWDEMGLNPSRHAALVRPVVGELHVDAEVFRVHKMHHFL
jgi:hypothetical protein